MDARQQAQLRGPRGRGRAGTRPSADSSRPPPALGHTLRSRGNKVFLHVVTALQHPNATPQLSADYLTLLRKHLLPVQDLVRKAPADAVNRLLYHLMDRLDGREEWDLSGEDVARTATTLADLLTHEPHDLHPPDWEAVARFLHGALSDVAAGTAQAAGLGGAGGSSVGGAGGGAADGRQLSPLVAATHAFLLRWGADTALGLTPLAAAFLANAVRVWASANALPRLREECFASARCLLRLGVLQTVPGGLRAVLSAALSETRRRSAEAQRAAMEERAGVRGGGLLGDGRGAGGGGGAHALSAFLTSQANQLCGPGQHLAARQVLELVADLWAHRAAGERGWAVAEDEDEEGGGGGREGPISPPAPRKRARPNDEWTLVFDEALSDPPALLPPLALLLHRTGPAGDSTGPPRRQRAQLAPQLWQLAHASLGGGGAAGGGGGGVTAADASVSLWALRCLRELAKLDARDAAVTRALLAAAAGDAEGEDDGGETDGSDPAAALLMDHDAALPCCAWAEQAAHLHSTLEKCELPAPLLTEVVHTFAHLLGRGLAPPPARPLEPLWLPLVSPNLPPAIAMSAVSLLFCCWPAGPAVVQPSPGQAEGRLRGVAWALQRLAPAPSDGPVSMLAPRRRDEPADTHQAAWAAAALCLGLTPPLSAKDGGGALCARAQEAWCEPDPQEASMRLLERTGSARDAGALPPPPEPH